MIRTTLTAARPLVLSALAIVAMTATAPAANASEKAMITIDNPTDNLVTYQFKWGNGEWTTFRLSANAYRNHFYELDDLGRAPAPSIRFDYILSDGEVTYRSYNLKFFSSYTTGYKQGKIYRFRPVSDRGILELRPVS